MKIEINTKAEKNKYSKISLNQGITEFPAPLLKSMNQKLELIVKNQSENIKNLKALEDKINNVNKIWIKNWYSCKIIF